MKKNRIFEDQLNIWHVSREMAPFAEAGGLKDVVSGLSESLINFNQRVTIVLPMYKFLLKYKRNNFLISFSLKVGNGVADIKMYRIKYNSIRILFVSADCFVDKELVYTYSRDDEERDKNHIYGIGHLDCDLMNCVLQRSAVETAYRLNEYPDVFHLHDGHTGFLPAIIHFNKHYKLFFRRTATLLTIHNAGICYQQNIDDFKLVKKLTGLPGRILKRIKTEYGYSPLLCAGLFGNINTVSKNYAREICNGIDKNSGDFGRILASNNIDLAGITNGISNKRYRTSVYSHIIKSNIPDIEMHWKTEYKKALFMRLEELGDKEYVFGSLVGDCSIPLITMQSRITYQKGVDLVCDSIEALFKKKARFNFLIVGEGEAVYEERLSMISKKYKNFCFVRKYNENLSQHLFAAGDFFLIPSRWEPCGLTDFIAQLQGNIPIVHETGGLVKTVNNLNGFSYKNNTPKELSGKIEEALGLYEKKSSVLHNIRKNAVNLINEKYTWDKVAFNRYLPFYRALSEEMRN